MHAVPAIVDVLNLFRHSSDWIETFLKLSPLEQAYIASLLGAVLTPVYQLVKAGLKKLIKRFRNK